MTIGTQTQTIDADLDSPRWRAVAGEYGVAALRHTHWLDDEARAYDDAPGVWAAVEGRVVGTAIDETDAEATIALAPGESVDVGSIRLRAIDRGGALALRVFDPQNPSRTDLLAIEAFAQNDAWVLSGAFSPAGDGETRIVRSVDGYEKEEPAVGTVDLEIEGAPVQLTVSGGSAGFSAVIADASSGVDAYRFRFLPIDAPAADGSVTVDFNRAFLPPCAFSDQYICPLPPAGNRLAVRIEAGERRVQRTAA